MYKKIISVLAVLAIMSAVCVFPAYAAEYTSESTFIWGDVDFDGAVTVKDATLIQKGLAKIEYVDAVQRYIADPEGIGYSVKNATAIQKYLARYESSASWGEEIPMASQDEFSSDIWEKFDSSFLSIYPKNGIYYEYNLEDFPEYQFSKIVKLEQYLSKPPYYLLYLSEPNENNMVEAIKALDYRANLDLESVKPQYFLPPA